jgi:hypothetical protein
VPNLISLFQCLGRARESISEALVYISQQIYIFTVGGLLAPRPTPKLEGHRLSAVCDLLIQYIHSHPPYLEAGSSIHKLRMHHAVVTRDPLNMAIKQNVNFKFQPSEYKTSWPYIDWCKFCIHLRSLNISNFGMVAAML